MTVNAIAVTSSCCFSALEPITTDNTNKLFFLFIYFDSYKHDVVVDIPKPRHMSKGLSGGRFGPNAADGEVGDEGGGTIVVFQR